MVDSWLVSHATPTSSSVELASPTHNQSRGGSGATTPVRKISAHEFERGGLLKPMISTVDGTPTFITDAAQSQGVSNSPTPGRRHRRSRHELRQLDEKELIFELVRKLLPLTSLECVTTNGPKKSLIEFYFPFLLPFNWAFLSLEDAVSIFNFNTPARKAGRSLGFLFSQQKPPRKYYY